jgi:hypothetical protein
LILENIHANVYIFLFAIFEVVLWLICKLDNGIDDGDDDAGMDLGVESLLDFSGNVVVILFVVFMCNVSIYTHMD